MFDTTIFSHRLTEARKARRRTKRALAEAIGLSETAIGQFESGKNLPAIATVVALADALDVSLDWLCGRTKENLPVKGGEAMTEDSETLAVRMARLEVSVRALESVVKSGVSPADWARLLKRIREQVAQQRDIPVGALESEEPLR